MRCARAHMGGLIRRFPRHPSCRVNLVRQLGCLAHTLAHLTSGDRMARKKEGRRKGQITPRGKDRWLVRVFLRRDAGGKRRYSAKTVKGSYAVAQRYLTKQLRDIDTRSFIEPSSQRLADYLLSWLETSAKPRVSP